ncbi:hypothetical protein Tco_1357606 [Tanacetum coccineum]
MSKYSTSCSLASGLFSWESSCFLTISINIMSPSSPLVQTSSVLDDWGTNQSDSKNELSLKTFSVINKIDGSSGVEGWTPIFSGLTFYSSSFSSVMSAWESLCCLGWIVTALIEPWTWVEHCGAPAIRLVMAFNTVSILLVISLSSRIVAEGTVQDRTIRLEPVSPNLFCSGLKVYHLPPALSVALEQDELPSSVELDLRARLDGGRMYLGHFEAKRLP